MSYSELQSDYNLIEDRCRRYREAYNDLKARLKEAEEKLQLRVAEVRKESAEELMLLRAQLRASNEKVAAFEKLCTAQQKELVEMAPALEMFKAQVMVKDCVLDAERKKTAALRILNGQLMSQLKRFNTQLSTNELLEHARQQSK